MVANHYERLDVSQDATPDEIEAGYQNQLNIHHAEIALEPQGLLWCLIQIARDTLLDDEKRAKYDSELEGKPNLSPIQPATVHPSPPRTPAPAPAPAPVESRVEAARPAISPARYTAPSPPVDASSALDPDTGESLLKNVKTPEINWNAMGWFNRNYSNLPEKIKTYQPGLKKGFIFSTTFFIVIWLVAIYAATYPFPALKGFPVNALIAIIVSIVWWKHFNSWIFSRKAYFATVGAFSVFSISSILFGTHEGNSVVPAIIAALTCAGAAYWGTIGAENMRRWRSINSSRSIIRKKLSTKEIKATTTWGTAGDLDDAIDKFGEQAVALGAAGEKFTATFMQELLKIPGTRIFHGLQFPGSENADVDHAIINGDKIVFVDSKLWKAATYQWGWDGLIDRVEENGKNTPINTNFHHAVLAYKKKMPEAQIRSRILIYPPGSRPVIVDNSNAVRSNNPDTPVTEMAIAQQFYEEVGNWFSEGTPGYINKNLVSVLYSNLKI